MLIRLILLIIGSIISAILYRMGGSDTFDTKWRDLGIPTLMILLMSLFGLWHWSLLLCFSLLFISLTTYFKKKGTDAKWWNWLLCGTVYGLSMLPFAWMTEHWLGFILRTIFLMFSITLYSELIGDVIWEECGRGFIIIASLGFFLI